jgi:hypothetical protein
MFCHYSGLAGLEALAYRIGTQGLIETLGRDCHIMNWFKYNWITEYCVAIDMDFCIIQT